MRDADRDRVESFCHHLGAERRLSLHTVLAYRRDLESLVRYCESSAISQWSALDTPLVRAFVAQRHRQGLSPASLQRLLSSVRTFYRYLQREGAVGRDPTADVRPPKRARVLPKTMDADQVSRLLDGNEGGDDRFAVRDQALMELMYSSGLRLSELTGLNAVDLELETRELRVAGKGAKTRVVPVGRKAVSALRTWLKERASLVASGEKALFVGANGRRLLGRTVQRRLRRWALRRGVTTALHPHMLRHSFASHLLQSSGDLRAVQELLGHANIGTTQIYTHLDFQRLAQVYDAAHPRARRKTGK